LISPSVGSDAELPPQSATAILYARPLSDGGFVAIEARQPAGASYHACVYVERRSDPGRRHGHAPPIVAEYEGPTRLSVMTELYRLAADDELIARGMARWVERKRLGN
jgi:hypothetical protein